MITSIPHRRTFLVIAAILLSTLLFIKCINNESNKVKKEMVTVVTDNKYEKYAGSITCAKCHQDIYNKHIKTAHYLTSQKADEKNIKGSFKPGENRFAYDGYVNVTLEKRNDHFYQVEYVDGIEKITEPFDITVGSGKRGQTFLYWNQNKLFQLPISYFTSAKQWSNSPGYSNKVVFRRPITSRCMECHSTYFQKISAEGKEPEDFSTSKIIYGVDCEKCHGPAARHVNFQTQHPNEKAGQFITNPSDFSRKQQLESCRLCHGGKLSKTKPSFSFEAGDALSDFFNLDTLKKDVANIDVHGNQYGMLIASKCFNKTEMTCGTCHNPHENETGKKEAFSQKCMNCHNESHNNFCKEKERVGSKITKNCIDCHMPEMPSKSIMVLLQGQSVPTPASMRSHYISIYPEQTSKFLAARNKK